MGLLRCKKKEPARRARNVRALTGGIRESGCHRRCGLTLDVLLEFVVADSPERSPVRHEALASGCQ